MHLVKILWKRVEIVLTFFQNKWSFCDVNMKKVSRPLYKISYLSIFFDALGIGTLGDYNNSLLYKMPEQHLCWRLFMRIGNLFHQWML